MDHLLRQLLAIDGVTGVLLIGRDGLMVASLMDGPQAEAHAALAAATFEAMTRYGRQLGAGSPRQALIEMPSAVFSLTESGDLVIVVEATAGVNLGQLRLESARVARELGARARG